MSGGAYRFMARPKGEKHGHPVLVFDRQERLHVPLTVFAKEAAARVASGTAQTYLHAILAFFTYLEADEWQARAGRRWDGPPGEVRQAVDDYLVQRLRCKVRPHRLGVFAKVKPALRQVSCCDSEPSSEEDACRVGVHFDE
ncbi:MAG: hypothetical protein HY675_23570 [Chloroflexi bacterium]|nr:hypothetical protein [Chloroflexota bacterium]